MMTEGRMLRAAFLPALLLVFWGLLCQWLVQGPPEFEAAKENSGIQWTLPPLADQTVRENAYETVMRVQPWGAKKNPQIQKAAEVITWQFNGVINVDGRRLALIAVGNDVRRYSPGEILPKGEVILAIGEGSIDIKSGEETRTIYLYPVPKKF